MVCLYCHIHIKISILCGIIVRINVVPLYLLGKTEILKSMMLYLVKITLTSAGHSELERGKSLLIHSNTLLEAFGNARTMRNNNASRFMRYTHVDFDFLNQLAGGVVTAYMLEKERVVTQQSGDRNFHIFYRYVDCPN